MNKKTIVIVVLLVLVLLVALLAIYSAGKKRQATLTNPATAQLFGNKIGNTKDWVMLYTTGMPFSMKAPKGWYAFPGNTPANFLISNKDDIKSTASNLVLMEVQGEMTKPGNQSTLEYAKANLVNKDAISKSFGTTETGLTIAKFDNIQGTPGSGTAYTVDLTPTKFAFIVVEKNGEPQTSEQIVQSIFLPIK